MLSGNMPETERLEKEQRLERGQKRLEINVNVSRPKEFLSNELNTRRLRTRATPASPPVVTLMFTSVPYREIEYTDRYMT